MPTHTHPFLTPKHVIRAFLAVCAMASQSAAFGETIADAASQPVSTLDQFVVTGTRFSGRTVMESPAPIDVVTEDTLEKTVSPELMDKLVQTVPSYNVQRLPLSDGLIFVRPATLRNLSPDQTLVLVNGKRRHRTAAIGSRGAQGVDLAQVPSFAISRVEVLRDGASAQYGSDAIAGVINIILKDKAGYQSFVQGSQYFEGDGFNLQAGVDLGVGIAGKGFFNLALEYDKNDATSRSVQRADALAYQLAYPSRAASVRDPVQRWGQPNRNAQRLVFNGEQVFGREVTLYSFGSYGRSEGVSDFNWRNPASNGAFKRSSYQDAPSNLYSDYSLLSRYPGGFTPRFGYKDGDLDGTLGAKGHVLGSLGWDASGSFGRSAIDYTMDDTVNPSFGPESPTSFKPGKLIQTETNANLDFSDNLDNTVFSKPIGVAFGGEFRREQFQTKAGDRFSWDIGPFKDLPSGSNGFPGWSPQQAVSAHRDSKSAYVDLQASPNSRMDVGLAGRYENYSDFGSTTNGKLSTRYELASGFAVRGAASTGFRAPTPGQSNYTRTSQGLKAGTSQLQTSGQIAVTSPVAIYFGAKPLMPEKSNNLSGGIVLDPWKNASLSIDYYNIKVKDRLSMSQGFTPTAAQRDELDKAGVVDAQNLSTISYFTNAFDTRTEGVDVVGSYRLDFSREDNLTFTAAYNHNSTNVVRYNPSIISQDGLTNIQSSVPKNAGNLSAVYKFSRWSLMARVRYYGRWTDAEQNSTIVQNFGGLSLFDLSITRHLGKGVKVTIGAENLFNTYPDKALYNAANGLLYSRNAPYDTDGGRWYLRCSSSF